MALNFHRLVIFVNFIDFQPISNFKYRPACCDTIMDLTSNLPTNCEKQCTDKEIFVDKQNMNILISEIFHIIGPMTLGIGFLVLVCGLVWIPIIREKYRVVPKKCHNTCHVTCHIHNFTLHVTYMTSRDALHKQSFKL